MRGHRAPAVAAIIAICVGLMDAPRFESQSPALEFQVKAVFLYNFVQFVQWPGQAFPERNTPFTICLAGDPFGGAMEKTVAGEQINGRPIAVRHILPADMVQGCHLIYVSTAEERRSAEIIKAAASMPLLTVGESENFIPLGGMIRFTKAANHVRFEINPDAAERASLRVSSRLLRLADIVRPPQRAGNP